MGWENYHLYEFKAGGSRIGPVDESDDEELQDAKEVRLFQMLDKKGRKLHYTYDFGDNWEHGIAIEKILEKGRREKYPLCTGGERACPPEDCGGAWGYQEFLRAIRDPKHKEHKEMMEWAGGSFDPERFDIDETNKGLGRRQRKPFRVHGKQALKEGVAV